MQILYEDNHLILVNKAPGEIVQPDPSGDPSLEETVKLYLKEKYRKPGAVFLGVVHRIDRPVSGVVLFAKTSKALARLNQMMKDRKIAKTYLAIVGKAPMPAEGTLKDYLLRDASRNKTFRSQPGQKAAKEAILHYKTLSASERYFLLEVQLETGRHHQIRCQLSGIGCPIRGDLKYGYARSNPDGGISLHAWKIEFIHPVTGNPLMIKAPVPGDTLWKALTESSLP